MNLPPPKNSPVFELCEDEDALEAADAEVRAVAAYLTEDATSAVGQTISALLAAPVLSDQAPPSPLTIRCPRLPLSPNDPNPWLSVPPRGFCALDRCEHLSSCLTCSSRPLTSVPSGQAPL
jgi:hypothetical protein